jgi:hypothetical protein
LSRATALRLVTDRYFAIPDTPFSPQYLLLRFMEPGQYIFFDTLLFYLIGMVGLVILYYRYRLSPFPFTILFLLFFFNGHITSHLAVGHSNWVSYFLLPYFVLLVLHLVERGRVGWRWVLGMTALFTVMLLQAGFHLYVWCLLFLGSLALINLRLLKPILLAGLFSVLAMLPRLLPPALVLEGITHEYLGGFSSVTELINNMIVLYDPHRAMMAGKSIIFPLNWWEVDFFIGLLGFSVLTIFGIVLPLLHDRSRHSLQVQILVPSLVMAVLSVGQIYLFALKVLRFPPFTGERVSSRFLILSLVFITVLAVIYMQRMLEKRASEGRPLQPWHQLLSLGMGSVLLHDLLRHNAAWRIRFLDGLVDLFPKVPFDPAQHTIANHPDAIYFGILIGGTVVSLAVFAFLIFMTLRERKQADRQHVNQ